MGGRRAAVKYQEAANRDAENCGYVRVLWAVDEDTESGAIPVQIAMYKLVLGD